MKKLLLTLFSTLPGKLDTLNRISKIKPPANKQLKVSKACQELIFFIHRYGIFTIMPPTLPIKKNIPVANEICFL